MKPECEDAFFEWAYDNRPDEVFSPDEEVQKNLRKEWQKTVGVVTRFEMISEPDLNDDELAPWICARCGCTEVVESAPRIYFCSQCSHLLTKEEIMRVWNWD